MNASVWATEEGWAVCEGPNPEKVKGYISNSGGWQITDSSDSRLFLDLDSAASAVLNQEFKTAGEYSVAKDGTSRIVRTPVGVIEDIKRSGWRIVREVMMDHRTDTRAPEEYGD